VWVPVIVHRPVNKVVVLEGDVHGEAQVLAELDS
jgi:hypothetical protein